MKELIEYVARSLVDDPSAVVVDEFRQADRVVLRLRVAPADMGRVIGRQGRIAQALRSLLRVAATRSQVYATLEIG